MMKRVKYIPVIIFIIIMGYIKFSGGLKLFSINSTSCEPNLKIKTRFIGSSYVKLKRNEFVYYETEMNDLGEFIAVHRLIALPGDTLECKMGRYNVNGMEVDSNLELRFAYNLDKKTYESYVSNILNDIEAYPHKSTDSIIVFLDDSFVESSPIEFSRYYNENDYNLSRDIFSKNSSWTMNNFGPIVIPKNKYFFSGDNRDNSYDSRYTGFVDKKKIKGTLLFKLF